MPFWPFRSGSGGGDPLHGIDIAGIPQAQDAIANWIQRVEEPLQSLNDDVAGILHRYGVRGEAQVQATANWVNRAIEQIKEVTYQLRDFSAALDQVKQNYAAQNQQVESQLNQLGNSDVTINTGVKGFDN